jgi:hypothetical protein
MCLFCCVYGIDILSIVFNKICICFEKERESILCFYMFAEFAEAFFFLFFLPKKFWACFYWWWTSIYKFTHTQNTHTLKVLCLMAFLHRVYLIFEYFQASKIYLTARMSFFLLFQIKNLSDYISSQAEKKAFHVFTKVYTAAV